MKTNGLAATLEALARAQPQKVALPEPERAVTYETPWSESQWVAESLTDAEALERETAGPSQKGFEGGQDHRVCRPVGLLLAAHSGSYPRPGRKDVHPP